MEGTETEGGMPKTYNGGALVAAYQVGLSPAQAANNRFANNSAGAKWMTQLASGPHVVMVSLGSNNPDGHKNYAAAIDKIMTTAGTDRQVFWYLLHYKPVTTYNADLQAAAVKYKNLHLVDVPAALATNPAYLPAPGLHPSSSGYKVVWQTTDKTISQYLSGSGDGNLGTGVSDSSNPCGGVSGGALGIGPDGCPLNATVGLDDGSDAIGVYELCKQAVAQAATPQAAAAIKQALRWLGAPYACGGAGRMDPFRFDCSSFVSRAYFESSGIPVAGKNWASTTRDMIPWDGAKLDPHYAFVAPADLRPGDLVTFYSCLPVAGCPYQHVAMYLGTINGKVWQVHTNYCGGVAHVTFFEGFGPKYAVGRRVVTIAGDPPLVIK